MNTQSKLLTKERFAGTKAFSAPLGAVKKGHLQIKGGVSNFELAGDPGTQDLFQGQFRGLVPDVRTRNERVVIHYRLSITEWIRHALLMNRHEARVNLNTSIPWQLDLHSGVSNLDADLRDIRLRSLEITGGVSRTEILLPRPSGTVSIRIVGGVSELTILRPEGVPAHFKVGGGASHLVFDDQSYGGIGDGLQLETPGYKGATERYDISVSGGVSNLAVRAQG